MEKEKGILLPLIVITLLVIILVIPLVRGIANKNNFPAQHEKEIKEWEEIVEKSCDFGEWEEKEILVYDLENRDIKSGIKPLKTKIIYCQGDYCNSQPFHPQSTQRCMDNRIILSDIEDKRSPSIFYYYEKIIPQITQHSIAFMFLALLIISSFILIEIYNIKKQK